jgi:hypothetical protein
MQHADRFYAIEGAVERRQVEDVGLSVFDIAQAFLARLSARVG